MLFYSSAISSIIADHLTDATMSMIIPMENYSVYKESMLSDSAENGIKNETASKHMSATITIISNRT